MGEDSSPSNLILISKKERINGWSWPLHPFQVVAWIFSVFIPLVYYGALVSHFPPEWRLAGCSIPGVLFFIHVIFHLVCLTIDPADPKIRQDQTTKATEFNRSAHKHVIENYHCYICQVDVGRKSKHCALCNKCISEFDHHCKWLNNCIGGQNYKLFIACVTTAFASAVSLLVFCLCLFIMYFKNKGTVMHSKVWSIFGKLENETFITLTSIIIALLALALLLLGHLLCFHIFLMHKGLSTYDFIVQSRQAAEGSSSASSRSEMKCVQRFSSCKANKVTQDSNVEKGEGIEMKMRNLQNDCQIEISDKSW